MLTKKDLKKDLMGEFYLRSEFGERERLMAQWVHTIFGTRDGYILACAQRGPDLPAADYTISLVGRWYKSFFTARIRTTTGVTNCSAWLRSAGQPLTENDTMLIDLNLKTIFDRAPVFTHYLNHVGEALEVIHRLKIPMPDNKTLWNACGYLLNGKYNGFVEMVRESDVFPSAFLDSE